MLAKTFGRFFWQKKLRPESFIGTRGSKRPKKSNFISKSTEYLRKRPKFRNVSVKKPSWPKNFFEKILGLFCAYVSENTLPILFLRSEILMFKEKP